MPTARNIDNLVKDLKEVLTEVKNSPAASGDMVALYGKSWRSQVDLRRALTVTP